MDAWGRDPSFQLAAIHWLIEKLFEASAVLGETPDPVWEEIQAGLPRACVEAPHGKPKIMLWQGVDLEESHRHHSHWGGVYPFDVIDVSDDRWRPVVLNTYDWWVRQGMGQWTGWCVPWAAMLHARAGSPEMTEATLEYWDRVFTNEGHGTLHDPRILKRTLAAGQNPAPLTGRGGGGDRGEVMQIEAGMAAAAAVLDALVHVRRGVHYLFPGVPPTWRTVAFDGIRTEGGFLVSAARDSSRGVTSLRIHSELGRPFRLANPWPGKPVRLHRSDGSQVQLNGSLLTFDTSPGVACDLTHE